MTFVVFIQWYLATGICLAMLIGICNCLRYGFRLGTRLHRRIKVLRQSTLFYDKPHYLRQSARVFVAHAGITLLLGSMQIATVDEDLKTAPLFFLIGTSSYSVLGLELRPELFAVGAANVTALAVVVLALSTSRVTRIDLASGEVEQQTLLARLIWREPRRCGELIEILIVDCVDHRLGPHREAAGGMFWLILSTTEGYIPALMDVPRDANEI